jgi:hypothetical protein
VRTGYEWAVCVCGATADMRAVGHHRLRRDVSCGRAVRAREHRTADVSAAGTGLSLRARALEAPKTIVAWERPQGGSTMIRRAVVSLAAVALGVGVFVSGAKAAAPICGSKACSEEIAAGCPGLSGAALKACKSLLLEQCKAGTCTCTMQPGLPNCPVTTPTTTPPSACCTQSTPGGPFDQCAVVSLPQCFAAGGLFLLGRICTPNPCGPPTTTSSTTTTTTLPNPTNPCAGDCDGACGPDEECAYARPVCACAPAPACGGSGGTCGGNCPAGSSACHFDTFNGFCLCEGPGCGLKGSSCTADQDCCNGLCDASAHYCTCLPPQASCTQALDCCSNTCGAGTCCIPTGSPCTTGSDCCSGTCDATGHCACLSPGAACADGSACCSGTCQVGQCTCLLRGASCNGSSDCCSGVCDASGQCSCLLPGAACSPDGNNFACCSGFCQSGQCTCSFTNLACRTNAECCSGTCETRGACQ